MATIQTLYHWFRSTGWLPALSCLNIALVLFELLNRREQNRRIWAMEFKFQGLLERIIGVHNKIATVDRRVSQNFVGNEDNTKIRKASKKIKDLGEFDDDPEDRGSLI